MLLYVFFIFIAFRDFGLVCYVQSRLIKQLINNITNYRINEEGPAKKENIQTTRILVKSFRCVPTVQPNKEKNERKRVKDRGQKRAKDKR